MGKTKKKQHENRDRQVQVMLPKSLIDAVKAKPNISFNEAGNQAIEKYIENKGEDMPAVPTQRSMLLLTPSLYDRLSAMAEEQGVTVTEAITHALEEYVIGEKRDNTEGWMITYAGTTASLRARINLMGETVTRTCGGLKEALKGILETLAEESATTQKEKERLGRLRKDVEGVYAEIADMAAAVHKYGQEDYDFPYSWTSEIPKTPDSGT